MSGLLRFRSRVAHHGEERLDVVTAQVLQGDEAGASLVTAPVYYDYSERNDITGLPLIPAFELKGVC